MGLSFRLFARSTLALLCLGLAVALPGPNLQAQTTPPADITITGEGADDDFGWHVAPAGDVNGDGVQDVIVGAPSSDVRRRLRRPRLSLPRSVHRRH